MESKADIQKLTKSADFARIKSKGSALYLVPWLTANYVTNQGLGLRVGWTVPSYVGTAVVRNRMKRWMRVCLAKWAAAEKQRGRMPQKNRDVNLVFRKRTKEFYKQLEHEEMNAAIENLFNNFAKKPV